MKKILNKTAQWKFIIPLLFLSTLFNFYLFPKNEVVYNNESLRLLDIRASYTKEDVLDLFFKMGDEGRNTYHYVTGVIDMIYPLIYGTLLILLLAKLFQNIFKKKTRYIYLALFPILIMIFDYIENINTLLMLDKYPEISNIHVTLGSMVSGIKWYLVSAILIIIITGFLFLLIKNIVLYSRKT